MIARALVATCVALLGAALLIQSCSEDGRTSTREAKGLIGKDYPFLFSVSGYEAAYQWHKVDASLQLLVTSGSIVFVRRPDAKHIQGERLQASLLRAAHRAHFQAADEFDRVDERPPASEREWIANAESLTVMDVIRRAARKKDPVPPEYVCRIWVAPDGSRYVAAYSTTD
jgi:hypothetical protein